MSFNKNLNLTINPYLQKTYEDAAENYRFKFLLQEMNLQLQSSSNLLDIGCAKGEFIYLVKKHFPQISCFGIDASPQLIELAKKEKSLSSSYFECADAENFHLNDQLFDIVVMSGLLSIFDDPSKCLKSAAAHMKPGTNLYIFGGFNTENIDTLVRYRLNDGYEGVWQSGWNMFSIETIKSLAAPYFKLRNTSRFHLPTNLPKTNDPVASYTIETASADRSRLILTGGNVVRDFHLLHFERS